MNLTQGGTVSGATTVAAKLASNEKDRTVYYLPDHTVKEPRTVIFTRANPGPEDNAVLRGSVKTVYGDRNADGSARSGNIIVQTTIAIPQDQTAALAEEALLAHVGVIRDTGITDDIIEMGIIPTSA